MDNSGQRVFDSGGADNPVGCSPGQCCALQRRWPRMVRAVASTARVGHPGRREPDRGRRFPGIVLWCCLSFTDFTTVIFFGFWCSWVVVFGV